MFCFLLFEKNENSLSEKDQFFFFFFGQVVTQQEENEGRQLDKLPSAR